MNSKLFLLFFFSNPQMGGNTIDELLTYRTDSDLIDQKYVTIFFFEINKFKEFILVQILQNL